MINNDRTLVQMKFIILNLRTAAFLHRWNNCLHNRWAYWYQSVGKYKFNQMRNCFENTPISNTYLCSTVGQCKIINNALLINYRWFSKLYFLINVVSLVSKLPEYFYADFFKKGQIYSREVSVTAHWASTDTTPTRWRGFQIHHWLTSGR